MKGRRMRWRLNRKGEGKEMKERTQEREGGRRKVKVNEREWA